MKTLLAVAAVLICSASAALAQDSSVPARADGQRPERPYRGLFGGRSGRPEGSKMLTLSASSFGAYDDNVLGDQGNPALLDPKLHTNGYYTGASGSLEYQRSGRTVSVGAEGGSSVRYYPRLSDFVSVDHHANLHASAEVKRTTVRLSQLVGYSPFYSFRFFPELLPQPDVVASAPDGRNGVTPAQAYTFNTSVGVTQGVSARGEVLAEFGVRSTRFAAGRGTNLDSHRGSVVYLHHLTKYAALRAGYGLEVGAYGRSVVGGQRARIHNIDLGVDYRKPLSFSRRTVVNFSFGSTAVETPAGKRVFRGTGNAGLTHEIGRTWNVEGAYRRAAGLVEGLAAPVFSDAVNVSLGGFVSRRIDLLVDSAYSNGQIGLTGVRTGFGSVSSSARLRAGLTRWLALFADYSVYQYRFNGSYGLPVGLPPRLNRQGVRAGLSMRMPLFETHR